MKAARKVFYNTGFLYIKLVITMLIALYSTRLVLKSLGVMDFGIFSVIAGIIAMLSFLNGAMTVTTQRYLSFYIGRNEAGKNRNVFHASVFLHLMIGFLVVLVLEGFYFILLDGWLNIPVDRLSSARWIYQFMVISTFFTINAVPYDALINSNEDLLFDSIVGVIESVLRLAIAFYLLVTPFDKLLTYGGLMALLTIIIRIVKSTWCNIKYADSRMTFFRRPDFRLLKEMTSYAGWNLFGAMCTVAGTQGVAIILNRFFGANINASYAVSTQVNSQLQSFSVMMVKAINPQIVKSEGGGNRGRMISLALKSSKFSVFLLLFMVIPIIAEMNFVLHTWLVVVPPFAVVFCTVILVNSIINQMSTGLKTAVQATGKIRLYQAVVGSTILMIIPLSYFLLSLGWPAYTVVFCSTGIEILALMIRLVIVKHITGMELNTFNREIIMRVLMITMISMGIALFPAMIMDEGWLRLLVVVISSLVSTSLLTWKFGLLEKERELFLGLTKPLWDRQNRTGDRQNRTGDQQERTGDRGPGTGNTGPGTGNTGPGTVDRGPRKSSLPVISDP